MVLRINELINGLLHSPYENSRLLVSLPFATTPPFAAAQAAAFALRLTIYLPGDYKVAGPETLRFGRFPIRPISSASGHPGWEVKTKMIPPAFEYLRPKTIPEAIAFLQQYGDDAKILSGGQSLIPMMKFRIARPGYLIDINRISGLSYIKEEDGYLKIGGLTREAELENSPLIHAFSKSPTVESGRCVGWC